MVSESTNVAPTVRVISELVGGPNATLVASKIILRLLNAGWRQHQVEGEIVNAEVDAVREELQRRFADLRDETDQMMRAVKAMDASWEHFASLDDGYAYGPVGSNVHVAIKSQILAALFPETWLEAKPKPFRPGEPRYLPKDKTAPGPAA